jgi:hypothetical protein
MMEAVSTSETSVNFYQTTRRNIPEDSYLQDKQFPKRRRLYKYIDAADRPKRRRCI